MVALSTTPLTDPEVHSAEWVSEVRLLANTALANIAWYAGNSKSRVEDFDVIAKLIGLGNLR